MKRLIQTLKNIWSIEDLRKRILYTISLVLVSTASVAMSSCRVLILLSLVHSERVAARD